MKYMFCFKLTGLAIAIFSLGIAPAFAQVDPEEYPNQPLEEEYPPTQRVGKLLCDRNLGWSLPTEFTEISPFLGEAHQLANHEGIDFIHTNELVMQVSVRSVADARVVYVRRDCPQSSAFEPNQLRRDCGGDWGNHIVLQHPNGLFTRYAHLYPESIAVKVGQKINRDQELGKMGNSGRSDKRHLHFELGVAIKLNPDAPAQSFEYVYNPVTYLKWENKL